MNIDAIDVSLIFAFIISVVVIVGASLVVSAYRIGFDAGRMHGVLREKNRRKRIEDRVDARINAQLRDEFEKELDV